MHGCARAPRASAPNVLQPAGRRTRPEGRRIPGEAHGTPGEAEGIPGEAEGTPGEATGTSGEARSVQESSFFSGLCLRGSPACARCGLGRFVEGFSPKVGNPARQSSVAFDEHNMNKGEDLVKRLFVGMAEASAAIFKSAEGGDQPVRNQEELRTSGTASGGGILAQEQGALLPTRKRSALVWPPQ